MVLHNLVHHDACGRQRGNLLRHEAALGRHGHDVLGADHDRNSRRTLLVVVVAAVVMVAEIAAGTAFGSLALLADGVAPDKLYPLDLDRAFKKLDTIKSDIVWWSGGAQSQQLLASGEAPLGQFWNGRVFAVQKDESSVGMSWHQNLTAADVLVVPKGSKSKAEAMKFLAMATSAKPQADMATLSNYAPINTEASKLMPAKDRAMLPDQHTGSQINLDMNYWAANRGDIGKRWYDWQAK